MIKNDLKGFVPIKGYEGIYSINRNGRIYHIHKQRLLKIGSQAVTGSYPKVRLVKNSITKTYQLHRLIAIAFIPNKKGYTEINHIDGIKTNFDIMNLEWCDRPYNVKHAYNNGLLKQNKDRLYSMSMKVAKLSKKEAIDIRKFVKLGIAQIQIARKYGVSAATVCNICKGRAWV